MDYKELYKEKLEAAKYWHDASEGDIPAVLEEIFDELRESEGEKIRKALIEVLREVAQEQFFINRGITLEKCLSWLEKQDPDYKAKTIKKEFGDSGENTAPEKDLPKFKIGDWITNGVNTWLIEGIQNGFYDIVSVEGDGTDDTVLHVDANFRLWTPNDAQAGDVLYKPEGLGVEAIFIVSEWQQVEDTGLTLCSDIVYRVKDDEIITGGLGAMWWEGVFDVFYPATKEQRDVLFKKMADEGYELDEKTFKAKKKVKQVEYPEEDIEEPSSEWTGKDSCHFDDISEILINLLHSDSSKVNKDAVEKDLDWLFSIKYRIASKDKWSEEDETVLSNLIWALKEDMNLAGDRDTYVSWLKSLRPQNRWKPSEEQIGVIEAVINNKSFQRRHLDSLYEQLKKLREK